MAQIVQMNQVLAGQHEKSIWGAVFWRAGGKEDGRKDRHGVLKKTTAFSHLKKPPQQWYPLKRNHLNLRPGLSGNGCVLFCALAPCSPTPSCSSEELSSRISQLFLHKKKGKKFLSPGAMFQPPPPCRRSTHPFTRSFFPCSSARLYRGFRRIFNRTRGQVSAWHYLQYLRGQTHVVYRRYQKKNSKLECGPSQSLNALGAVSGDRGVSPGGSPGDRHMASGGGTAAGVAVRPRRSWAPALALLAPERREALGGGGGGRRGSGGWRWMWPGVGGGGEPPPSVCLKTQGAPFVRKANCHTPGDRGRGSPRAPMRGMGI